VAIFTQIFVIFAPLILDSGGFVRVLTYNMCQENTMRTMVGKIASVDGVAEVIDARGQHRALVAGDLLREGDQVVTASGATLALEAMTGELIQFNGQQTITMTTQLTAQYVADASDDAIHPWLLQHVLASVQSGEDVLDIAGLLAELPVENTFSAFAATVLPDEVTAALHIDDLIQDHAASQPSGLGAGAVDLMASTSLPSEVALQQSLLKDFIKD